MSAKMIEHEDVQIVGDELRGRIVHSSVQWKLAWYSDHFCIRHQGRNEDLLSCGALTPALFMPARPGVQRYDPHGCLVRVRRGKKSSSVWRSGPVEIVVRMPFFTPTLLADAIDHMTRPPNYRVCLKVYRERLTTAQQAMAVIMPGRALKHRVEAEQWFKTQEQQVRMREALVHVGRFLFDQTASISALREFVSLASNRYAAQSVMDAGHGLHATIEHLRKLPVKDFALVDDDSPSQVPGPGKGRAALRLVVNNATAADGGQS